MKIKRLKSIKINSTTFYIIWNKKHNGGAFDYGEREIEVGVKSGRDERTFEVLCHEIMEICAIEMHIRLSRPDVDSDYMFVYDHRQYTTMMAMFSGVISKFIKG